MFIAWTTGNHVYKKKRILHVLYLIHLHAYIQISIFCVVSCTWSRSKKYAIPSKEIYIKSTENTKGY